MTESAEKNFPAYSHLPSKNHFMNYKAFTQIAIDLLPAKLCNCTQAIMTHIITSFLAFMFF
ncbi:hypothetical protein [Escherichia coli]|uniref:hypothetical protein n=1 Tax=Escherichia coli TaxID=562 RepID=UPI00403FC9A7